jgi:pimeloyl-ACP methyl ester carboxylesterase
MNAIRILLCLLFAMTSMAAERTVSLNGVPVTLDDVSDGVAPLFQSMRLNRALNVWNVELSATNRGTTVANGPLVFVVDSAVNTAVRQPDGLSEGSAFVDLTERIGSDGLAPGSRSSTRTLTLEVRSGTPSLTGRFFARRPVENRALALARTLNEAGQPLPGVEVTESGPDGLRQLKTDGRFGIATLGGVPGDHVWKFSQTNRLPVWRSLSLPSAGGPARVDFLVFPRLPLRDTNAVTFTTVGGGELAYGSDNVRIAYAPGAFMQSAVARLTRLTGQTLPGLLPLGWSPLQAFWLELDQAPTQPATARLTPWGPLRNGEPAALVRWDEATLNWIVQQILPGDGTNTLTASVNGAGAYALVVADTGSTEPPAATVGEGLRGGPPPLIDGNTLTAVGTVDPATRSAGGLPEQVTATARVTFAHAGSALHSGLPLRTETTESYRLRDGSLRVTPGYEGFFVGYQRPGDDLASTLQSSFPLRPLKLEGGDVLQEASIRVDVLAPFDFSGPVFETNGGLATVGPLRLAAAAGQFVRPQAASLRELSRTDFTGLAVPGFSPIAAFEFGIGETASPLAVQGRVALTNGLVVLARLLYEGGEYGLEPLERFRTGPDGALTSLEPATGPRLPGLDGAGVMVLLAVDDPQTLLDGTARDTLGAASAGLAVRSLGTPWLTFSGTNGGFRLLASAGSRTIRLSDVVRDEQSDQAVEVPGNGAANLDLALTEVGPVVVSTTPTNAATQVSRVSPISVQFSRKMNVASVATGVQLLAPDDSAVPASVSLNLAGSVATVSPISQLAASTAYRLILSTNLADTQGRKIGGALAFGFTTEADTLDRSLAALTIFEPTNGLVAVSGAPGTAEPEAPVILVNETTGRTATILSKPDGSFTNNIEGAEDDYVSAVIVNRNGTRTTVPASRQMFRDGRVGLFSGGGILEASNESGNTTEVMVEPGSVPAKTLFRVTSITAAQLQGLLAETPPALGTLLPGVSFEQEGDELSVSPDIAFPVDLASLGFTNAEQASRATFALTVPRELEDGVIAYEIIDKLELENGKLVTHSPPFTGALLQELARRFKSARAVDSKSSKILKVMGLPSIKETALHVLLMPLVISQGTKLIVIGETASYEVDAEGKKIDSTKRILRGATVTFAQDGFGAPNGRIQPGGAFTTSGSDGRYSLVYPINRLEENGFVVRGTHPGFPAQRSVRPVTVASIGQQIAALSSSFGGLGGGVADLVGALNANAAATTLSPRVRADLEFYRGDAGAEPGTFDSGPPVVTITASTGTPANGTNNGSGAIITVSALDDVSATMPTLVVADNQPISALITNNPVVITPVPGSTTNIGTRFVQGSFRVTSQFRANVTLRATAADGAGNLGQADRLLAFGADPVPAPMTGVGPRVLSAVPANGSSGAPLGTPVRLDLSKPLSQTNLPPVSDWLAVVGGTAAGIELSPDGRTLTVHVSPDPNSGAVLLTLSEALLDATGVAFDQDPAAEGNQSYTLQFSYAAQRTYELGGIASGGGVVVQGANAFALERAGSADGELIAYDLRNEPPSIVGRLSVPGFPRDIAMIPDYGFKLKTAGPALRRNLVAVVGGVVGAESFQYLWIIDVSDPSSPKRIASANVTLAIAAVTKVQWAPPFLAYLESGADQTSVSLVHLQQFLVGLNATPAEITQFPEDGAIGKDLNGDGDFVDAGEELPLPERNPVEFFGKIFSFIDADSDRRIEDFAFDSGSGLSGIVMSKGHFFGNDGLPDLTKPASAAYRTVLKGPGSVDPTLATVDFPAGLSPKRVAVLPQVTLGTTTNQIVRDLAVASLNGSSNVLAVIDVTDGQAPSFLAFVPVGSLGIPQSLLRRSDGLLALATSTDVVLIDPTLLLLPNLGAGLPPAIVGIVAGAGSGARSFASTEAGVSAVNLGSKHQVVFDAPKFSVVALGAGDLVPAADWPGLGTDVIEAKLRTFQKPERLTKAALFQSQGTNPPTLVAPNRATHYYLRVDAFGGLVLNGNLPLVVRSLNPAGRPLPTGGSNSVPVVVAQPTTLTALGITNQTLPLPMRMIARRLSDDAGSALYNVFLAGPFVVTDRPLTAPQASQVETQLPRAVLKAGRYLQAALDPTVFTRYYQTGFVSKVSGHSLVPGTSLTVPVLHVPRPLIFVPGMAGSHLENRDSLLGLLPFGLTERWPGYIGKFQEELSLDPSLNGSGFPGIVASDAIRQTPEEYTLEFLGIGDGQGLGVNTYSKLLRFITGELGYVEYDFTRKAGSLQKPKDFARLRTLDELDVSQVPRAPTFFVFPYDWRKSSASNAVDLAKFMEVVRYYNPEAEQVDLVAHSNGGLVARRFILDNPGAVNRFVSLASPFAGATKIIAALETGDLDDSALNFVLRPALAKKLTEYFPGFFQLLPGPGFFELGGRPLVESGWDLNENGQSMEAYDLPAFEVALDRILHPRTNVFPVATAKEFQNYTTPFGGQADWRNDASGVDYVHIYAVQKGANTISQVRLVQKLRELGDDHVDLSISLFNRGTTDEFDAPLGGELTNKLSTALHVLDRRFETMRGPGDGTVPEISLSRIGNGKNLNAPNARLVRIDSPSVEEDEQYAHNPMTANPRVLRALADALAGVDPTNAVVASQASTILDSTRPRRSQSADSPDYFRIELINAEEGSVELQDSNGRSTAGQERTLGPSTNLLSQRIITWLQGINADLVNPTCVEFNLPAGAVGPYKIVCRAGEAPLAISVAAIHGGVVVSRTLHPGRLLPTGTDVVITVPVPPNGLTFAPDAPTLGPVVTLTGAEAADAPPPLVAAQMVVPNDDGKLDLQTTGPAKVFVGADNWDEKTMETELLYPVENNQLDLKTLENEPYFAVAVDSKNNAGPPTLIDPPLSSMSACDIFDVKRDTLRSILVTGLNQARADGWLLSTSHVKALEQGSGACLWQRDTNGNLTACDNCPLVFDPNKSDHDIELFLPCYLSGVPANLVSEAHRTNVMAGDWYFRRPAEDGPNWRYERPGGTVILRNRTDFTNAAPAEIIANLLNLLAEEPASKKILKEASFFPVRFEYFTNGVLDIESVGAYLAGSDPIGDAGLGRQLLLLKWVLEGEWVDSGTPTYDLQGPDLNDIWLRLANSDIPRLEGLEWCELQQNAAWSSGFMLRTLLPPDENRNAPAGVNFLRERAQKQVKSLGKAALRTTAALLAGADEADELFSDSRNVYQQKGFTSFEGYIASRASNNLALMGPYKDMLDPWLKAKLGDKQFLDDMLTNDCVLNTYLQQSIQFIFFARDEVFTNHEIDLDLLRIGSIGQQAEYRRRTNNLAAIRRRIDTATLATSLDLELKLMNRSKSDVSGLVKMTFTGQSDRQESVTIPAASELGIKGSVAANKNFFISLLNTDTTLHDVMITLPTPGSLKELRLDNNFTGFGCYILNLVNPCDTAADYNVAPPTSLFGDDKLSSPFRTPNGFDPGFLPGVTPQFLADQFKSVFGEFPQQIFVVGSRTLGNNSGDIDTVFVTDRVIDRNGADREDAWLLFFRCNPQLQQFIIDNAITGIGFPTDDNPNPRGLGYDPDDIPKGGAVDTIFAPYYEMTRPGVRVWP